MNRQEFHAFVSESKGNESNICQICAIKDDAAVYEDCWRGFKAEDPVNVNSVTKGVMALLAGIAHDKGFIRVEDKVMDYFPDYQVKRGEKTIYDVTVRHLLTMTAPYKGRSEPWKKVCTSDDWTKAALDFLGGRAGIIERASGEKLIDFANKNLFIPLGIPEHTIHGDSSKEDQFDFFMNKGPRKNEWYSDPQDTVTAGWGLCASAKDLALIGAMVLNNGRSGGKEIVSSDWINSMLTPYQKLGERFGNMYYGYLWYKPFDGREVYAAIGDCGNIIYVNREENVAVGVTGTFKPMIFDRVEFIEKRVLPLTM